MTTTDTHIAAELKTKVLICDYWLTSNYGWRSLDTMIADFLNKTPMEVVSIQYSSVIVPEDKGYGYCRPSFVQRSAMIVYKLVNQQNS